MSDQPVSVPKAPDAPGWWWAYVNGDHTLLELWPHADDDDLRVDICGTMCMLRGGAFLPGHEPDEDDDVEWLAPVLTPAEVAALTAERDEARECAEIAAAAENANAAELREARAVLAELTQRLDPYVERNHDDGGTHAEALDSLIADAVRYSEVSATLDAVAALVGGGDVVAAVQDLLMERDTLAAWSDHAVEISDGDA